MRYLLDTNIVSALMRDPRGAVAQRIRAAGESNVCTSVIVAAELRFGAERRRSARLTKEVEAVLRRLAVLPLDIPADRVYASLRTRLEVQGRVISGNDLLIAAHALAAGCTLVSDNEWEFGQIPQLETENWLR